MVEGVHCNMFVSCQTSGSGTKGVVYIRLDMADKNKPDLDLAEHGAGKKTFQICNKVLFLIPPRAIIQSQQ